MKLIKGTKKPAGEEYRQVLAAEYRRMAARKALAGNAGGLEEVKLRLFLSLLDVPEGMSNRRAANS
jgi:hypothetical protein